MPNERIYSEKWTVFSMKYVRETGQSHAKEWNKAIILQKINFHKDYFKMD